MSDPNPSPSPSGTPAPTPGERRLAHPPSDRYRAAETTAPDAVAKPDPTASVARGLAIAVVAAIIGAIAIVVLGGVLTFTAGLIVVAAATGWGVGGGLRFGAGARLRPGRRVIVALVIAVAAIALGQLGLWQYGRSEGGVLPPVEYLVEVFGPLVPLQFVAAALVAWLTAR